MFRIGDLFIYLFFVILFSFMVLFIIRMPNVKPLYVEIYENGKLTYRYKLVKEKKTIEVNSNLGKELIQVEDFKVKKIKASCPNKFCLTKGYIKKVGDIIVCAPNKEIIKITGGTIDNNKVDVILE